VGHFNVIERRLERFMHEPPSVRNAAGVTGSLALGVFPGREKDIVRVRSTLFGAGHSRAV
jgi:hypothetical protein